MNDTEKAKIIELLTKDLQDEHAAIVQYLIHAYAFGEGELACELEAIAREEMQHFRWLAEMIVELGGYPSMKRGEVVFAGPKLIEMLQADVHAEEKAIKQYEEHIAAIDDPDVKILLERILTDEKAHYDDFTHFEEQQDPDSTVRMESALAEENRETAEFMQKMAEHEYTVVLQYLAHAFLTPHCEVEHEMEWQAIEEMRHLGWLAEEMEELGTRAEMKHDPLVLPESTADMLKVDIATEEQVAEAYRRQAGKSDDEDTQKLFTRLAKEEDHHIVVFSKLLDEVEEAEKPEEPPAEEPRGEVEEASEPSKPGFTVGSLLNREQR